MKIDIKQATSTKTRNGLLIATSIIGIGIFSFAVVPALLTRFSDSPNPGGGSHGQPNGHSNGHPAPLIVTDITELYSDMFDHLFGEPTGSSCVDGSNLFVKNGIIELGRFVSTNPNQCNITFVDGQFSGEQQPLSVIAQNGDFPLSQHMTIKDSLGEIYTICLGDLSSGEQRFFDTEGTPYFDISLTNSALSGSCSSLLNRGMVLNVYEAGTSALYPENFDYHAITRGSFWDDIWEFGYLYPANFDREALCGDCYLRAYGNAPLAIAPHPNISSGETLVTPQDMITVWDVAGEVKNVCLPSITLPDSLDSEVTYIDHEGNAFEDALLTQKIHESDCSTVIQNSFAPTDLVDVGLSQELAENGTLIFHRAVLGDVSYQFGNYNEVGVSSPVFVDDNVLANNSGHAPLIIAYQNKFSEESIIFPKQVFTFDSDLGVVTACVPALTLENSKKKLIYVSTNGNTYYDPLLQEMTTITSCSTLLSSGAQPKIILSASTTSLPDYGAIAFSRGDIYDARLLGWLRWDDGWVEGDYPADSPILIGTAPLVIALQNHGEESFTWPQQTVIISSDIGDYEVCIPETQVDPGAVLLYLKLDNTIYQDPFFQQPIQCG